VLAQRHDGDPLRREGRHSPRHEARAQARHQPLPREDHQQPPRLRILLRHPRAPPRSPAAGRARVPVAALQELPPRRRPLLPRGEAARLVCVGRELVGGALRLSPGLPNAGRRQGRGGHRGRRLRGARLRRLEGHWQGVWAEASPRHAPAADGGHGLPGQGAGQYLPRRRRRHGHAHLAAGDARAAIHQLPHRGRRLRGQDVHQPARRREGGPHRRRPQHTGRRQRGARLALVGRRRVRRQAGGHPDRRCAHRRLGPHQRGPDHPQQSPCARLGRAASDLGGPPAGVPGRAQPRRDRADESGRRCLLERVPQQWGSSEGRAGAGRPLPQTARRVGRQITAGRREAHRRCRGRPGLH